MFLRRAIGINMYNKILKRNFSSKLDSGKSKKNSSIEYLETWVGRTNRNRVSKFPEESMNLEMELSSYMLPTLRLNRNDSLNCISKRFQEIRQSKPLQPILLDLNSLAPDGSPHYIQPTKEFLSELNEILLKRGIKIVGLSIDSACIPGIEDSASTLGLPFVMKQKQIINSNTTPNVTDSQYLNKNTSKLSTKVFRGNVRSGQQIYAENGNLVVIGNVHSGGEVISDGDIHIYGKLNGRAFAGLKSSNDSAFENTETTSFRIFATRFDPELVCIQNEFTTMDEYCQDETKFSGQPVMVSFHDDTRKLKMELISL